MANNNELDILAKILVYNEIRQHEEFEMKESELKALCNRPGL